MNTYHNLVSGSTSHVFKTKQEPFTWFEIPPEYTIEKGILHKSGKPLKGSANKVGLLHVKIKLEDRDKAKAIPLAIVVLVLAKRNSFVWSGFFTYVDGDLTNNHSSNLRAATREEIQAYEGKSIDQRRDAGSLGGKNGSRDMESWWRENRHTPEGESRVEGYRRHRQLEWERLKEEWAGMSPAERNQHPEMLDAILRWIPRPVWDRLQEVGEESGAEPADFDQLPF